MAGKSLSKPERKRKLNFSTSEISKITELVEENLEIIQSKLTNSVTNRTKQETRAKITTQVNAIGVAYRSAQEMKDKWKNLQSTAKKEFVQQEEALDKQAVVHRVRNLKRPRRKLFDSEKARSFTGLHGFETSGKFLGKFRQVSFNLQRPINSCAWQKILIGCVLVFILCNCLKLPCEKNVVEKNIT